MNRCLVLLMALVASHAAGAAGNDAARGAGAAAGIFAGIYIHELGHAAAFYEAGAEEIRIRVPGPWSSFASPTAKSRSTRTGRRVGPRTAPRA